MIIADTHVHVYPTYDVERMLAHALVNLGEHARGSQPAQMVLFLTERHDCNFFYDLSCGRLALQPDYCVSHVHPNALAAISTPSGDSLYIVAGRQVATSEQLEVLCLGSDERIEQGQPIRAVIERALALKMVPVVPWSPGKWLGARGKIVEELVSSAPPRTLLFSDSALRPKHCPEPPVFARARERAIEILCGSDPLPLHREERRVGSYACMWSHSIDTASPLASLLSTLYLPSAACGQRLSMFAVASRLLQLKIRARI